MIKSYKNTQLEPFTPVFQQIPWINAEPIDYNRLKNLP
jgi:hypothetical protein